MSDTATTRQQDDADTRALHLTIDVRETALLAAVNALREKLVAKNKPGIRLIVVDTEALPVGDIKIHTKAASAPASDSDSGSGDAGAPDPGRTLVLVERKSLADLAASISDGRYREQKARLLEAVGGDQRARAVYVIEGGTLGGDPDRAPVQSAVKADSLWGMIVNSTFRDRLSVLRTASTEETALLLVKIALLVATGNDDAKSAAVAGLQKTPSAARKDLPGGLFACMLSQLPGCSLTRASAVATKFGSISALCLDLQADRVGTEKQIAELKADGSRRLGPALAARIGSVCCDGRLPEKRQAPPKKRQKKEPVAVPEDAAPV